MIPPWFEPFKILCKIYNVVIANQMTICYHHFTIKQDVSMRQALSHYKHEASCIYVNNVRPWNAIKYFIKVPIESIVTCEVNLHNGTLTCSEHPHKFFIVAKT